jgi:hypothetical protein
MATLTTGVRFKDDVHSVLRISFVHNKGGPPDINIAHILHLSNFFELKRTVYVLFKARVGVFYHI